MDTSGFSYRHGLPVFPHSYVTIPDQLRKLAREHPNKEAVIIRFGNGKRDAITFGQLLEKSVQFAEQLVLRGLKKGDYVAIFIHNSIEWVIAELGVIVGGGIAVTVSSIDEAARFSNIQKVWGMVLDIRDIEATEELKRHIARNEIQGGKADLDGSVKHIVTIKDPDMKLDSINHCLDFDTLMDTQILEGKPELPAIDPDDVCLMFSTSGSTGASKRIPHTHVSIFTHSYVCCHVYDMTSSDIFFNDRPLGYIGGFPYYVLADGITLLAIDTRQAVLKSDQRFVFDLLIEERATCGLMAPYLTYGLEKITRLPKLKFSLVGGQRLTKEMINQYLRFTENPIMVYGSSESLHNVKVDTKDLRDQITDVLGYITPSHEVKIIDDLGAIVPEGTYGEICLRSASVGQCYIMMDGSVKALKDSNGWFHTGDVGFMKPDGLLLIKGRTKEIIKRATIKIFPGEVEMPLRSFPGVDDVVVIGVPDERLYEEVCACVISKTGSDFKMESFVKYAHEQFQPEAAFDGYGIMPKYFLILESIPQIKTGKIDRTKIATWAANNLVKALAYEF